MAKLPVSFDQFKKDPMKAILYIALGAIMYLYIDNKMIMNERVEDLMQQNKELVIKTDTLQKQVFALSIKLAEMGKENN
jgi:hypothetical protein